MDLKAALADQSVTFATRTTATGITIDGGTANLIGQENATSRVLSPIEISALADPSNVMLSGLILPPRRVLFA